MLRFFFDGTTVPAYWHKTFDDLVLKLAKKYTQRIRLNIFHKSNLAPGTAINYGHGEYKISLHV